VISFGYELESPRNVEDMESELIPILEQQMVDILLPSLFSNDCDDPMEVLERRRTQRRALLRVQTRRRLEVVGISKNPDDSILEDIECASKTDPTNSCVVVRGEMTLYANDDEALESEATTTKQSLKDHMDDGSFNDTEVGITRVSYVDLSDRTPSITTPEDNEIVAGGGGSNNDNGRLVRVTVMVAGAGLLVLMAGIALFRRRKDEDEGRAPDELDGEQGFDEVSLQ
jgi:hypothetical protein